MALTRGVGLESGDAVDEGAAVDDGIAVAEGIAAVADDAGDGDGPRNGATGEPDPPLHDASDTLAATPARPQKSERKRR